MKISDWINTIIYLILIICLIIWNFVPNLFPNITANINILLVILITVLLASEVSMVISIRKIEDKITMFNNNELIEADDLSSALTNAISSRKAIKTLRIYALSTNMILPIIRGCLNCTINECKLLLRSLNDEEYAKNYTGHVEILLDEWDSMKNGHKIQVIEKSFFDDIPSEYNIIIDDDILIIGNYIFTNNRKHRSHLTINDVFTITNARANGNRVIDMYIKRFDESFQYFQEISKGQSQK